LREKVLELLGKKREPSARNEKCSRDPQSGESAGNKGLSRKVRRPQMETRQKVKLSGVNFGENPALKKRGKKK